MKIMASSSITSWQTDWETMETVTNFIFLWSKITADGDCNREIKIGLLLGRKAVANLNSILKCRGITSPTKFCPVKALVFPVVMYGCEGWTIERAEHQRIDAFELWGRRRLLRVPWTSRRSNQSILKHISSVQSTQSYLTLCSSLDCSLPGSSVREDSPGKNTGVGCHDLLQGIFPTQGSNPGPLHWRRILYHLSHQASPRILEWVAYPFFRGSSQPRNPTVVSCIAGGGIREAQQRSIWPQMSTEQRLRNSVLEIIHGLS